MQDTAERTEKQNGKLLPQHLAELQASGLNERTIEAAGIYSECDRRKLASLLNRKRWPSTWGAGLIFPNLTADGIVSHHRCKPEHPPKQGSGSAKYLSPTGQPCILYVPPDAREALGDTDQRLLVTEGEKKALAATQYGFPCVGLSGVDCWHPKGSAGLIPDLAAIEWNGREVLVAFDSDAADNENVRRNESLLAAALKARGAAVRVVRLPSGPDGAKWGLDDFLVANGDRDLQKLVEQAEDPEPVDAGELRQPAKDADPATEAERIVEEAKDEAGILRLRFWRGTFWLWSHGRYRELTEAEIRAKVVRHLKPAFFGVGQGHVGNVMEHLRAETELSATVEAPAWLSPRDADDWPCNEVLACRNGLVHLPSLVANEPDYMRPATPRYYAHSATDFDFDVEAPEPVEWLRFLEKLWPDDPQAIETLQEWFGYCLVADTSQQKILLLVGPTRSGKGTIGRVQRTIVGSNNVIGPTLTSLSGPFGLWQFVAKPLAIISDARLSGRADQAAIVEQLLSISGEDCRTVDRKCLPPVSCTLPTRIMLISNELPKLRDASGAMAERFILLRLTESFLGREDTGLTGKLLEEAPSILLWSILGWQRLRERGHFQQPDSSMETLAALRDIGSPVAAFVRDECTLDPVDLVEKDTLYDAYKAWCESNGTKHVPDKETFARDLLAAFPQLKACRPRRETGRFQAYQGIRLRFD